MTRAPVRLAGLIGAALLASCQSSDPADETAASAAPAEQAAPARQAPPAAASLPVPQTPGAAAPPAVPPADPQPASAPPGDPIPHIYMALQPGGTGRPTSVIFAIDAARDGTPGDDPAIRLTPDGGLCNPQEMRSYDFPAHYAARPVVGETEQARGLGARDLPAYLAVTVSERMLEAGLADELQDTRAQNICTRKLWERLVLAQSRPREAAGQ